MQPCLAIEHGPFPTFHGEDLQRSPDIEGFVKKASHFCYGETVAHGEREMTHERTELEVKEISFTLMAANGIWSIENHNFNVMTKRS